MPVNSVKKNVACWVFCISGNIYGAFMSVILDVFCFSEKQKLAFKELEEITYGNLLRADCLRFYYAKEI